MCSASNNWRIAILVFFDESLFQIMDVCISVRMLSGSKKLYPTRVETPPWRSYGKMRSLWISFAEAFRIGCDTMYILDKSNYQSINLNVFERFEEHRRHTSWIAYVSTLPRSPRNKVQFWKEKTRNIEHFFIILVHIERSTFLWRILFITKNLQSLLFFCRWVFKNDNKRKHIVYYYLFALFWYLLYTFDRRP